MKQRFPCRHGSVIFAGARRRRRTSRRGLSRRFLPHRPLRRSGRLHHRNICRGQRKGLLAYHQGIPAQADCKTLDIFSFLSQGRTEMRCRQAFWCAYLSFRGGRICRVSERRQFQEARYSAFTSFVKGDVERFSHESLTLILLANHQHSNENIGFLLLL